MIISIYSPDVANKITYISCGSTSPQLSGHIDLSGLNKLRTFRCINNSLTGLYGYGDNKTLIELNASTNKIQNNIERLDNKPLDLIYMQSNLLSGEIPNLPNSTIRSFFNNNRNLTGTFPPLSSHALLQEFSVSNCSLAGSIPSLSACVKLKVFNASGQQGVDKISGSIGNLEYNTSLNTFIIHSNQISNWSGGSVPSSLNLFLAQNNLLDTSSVDNLLQAFVDANGPSGVLNLGGTGNQSPGPTGLTNRGTLVSRGWTVTTN
jgi:hypothetical protein